MFSSKKEGISENCSLILENFGLFLGAAFVQLIIFLVGHKSFRLMPHFPVFILSYFYLMFSISAFSTFPLNG